MNETSHALNEIEILTRDRDEWKHRALAAEERLTWIRGGLKTLAEADDMTTMVKP